MATRPPSVFKRLVIDIAGGVLIIASVLTGWIPGPGGIPLFLSGLGLLAINHEWAERMLEYFQRRGIKVLNRLFIDHPIAKILLDAAGIGLLILSFNLLRDYTSSIILSLGISAGFASIALFLGNRRRLQHLTSWLKRRFKR
jgi:hypothetical protein